MGQLAPYIPSKDADLQNWALNFSTLLTNSPATYGVMTADAAAVAAAYASWTAAYSASINPATKTPVTVAAKDAAKISLLSVVRPYAQTIANNAGVSSANKIALGINPRTSVPSPISTPSTSPVISIDAALTLQHVIRFRDQLASPSIKAKPYGAIQMQLYASASATPITDPSLLTFKGALTKAPTLVDWTSGDAGKQAYYAGRWVTRRGLVGPWSPIVNFTIAA